MFAKTMASWTMDLLNQRDPRWPEADPEADYRNRDWKRMYAGSVLDD